LIFKVSHRDEIIDRRLAQIEASIDPETGIRHRYKLNGGDPCCFETHGSEFCGQYQFEEGRSVFEVVQGADGSFRATRDITREKDR